MSQSQVSLIMTSGRRQRRVTALDVVARIADGLDMPNRVRELLGLAPANVDRGRIADIGPRDRPSSGRVSCDSEPWTLAETLTRSTLSPTALSRLERIAAAQLMRYPSTPPLQMWPIVRQELAHAECALAQRQTLTVQHRLVGVVGVFAGLAGNLCVDLGHRAAAWEYFDISRLAGEETGDGDLIAWALALQSIDSYFAGSTWEAADLLDRAARAASCSSSARRRCWIAALRARAYAAKPDGRAAALASLDEAYFTMRNAVAPYGSDFFDQERLDGLAGETHLLLRDTGRALEFIDRAITRRSHSDAKGRALLTLDKAACRVIDQEYDDAVDLVHEALDVAEGQLVRPIVARILQVRSTMRTWRDADSINALQERLTYLLPPAEEA